MLGTDLGTAHHPMNLSVDLPDLMESLDDYEVYVRKPGRYLDDDDMPVTNITSSGLNDLLNGKSSPLNDYNTAFIRLQARRRLVPLVNGQDSDPCPSREVSPLPNLKPNDIAADAPSIVDIQQLDVEEGDVDSDEDSEEDGESEGSESDENEDANDDGDSENDDEAGDVDDEDIGDFLRSFEDTSDEGTLSLDNAADVSLDMDAEDLGLDEDSFDEDEGIMSESDDEDATTGDNEEADNIFRDV